MNPIDIIKKDHRTVEGLFAQYEELGDQAYEHKKEIAAQIIVALEQHTEMEETLAYPVFKDAFGVQDDKMVEEAIAEHGVAKDLIAELKELSPEDEQLEAKMTVLRENIQHHVEEEETEVLPKAQEEVSEEDMSALGEEMLIFKEGLDAA
jgi:hemerythrin-like domain-containing protein